MYQFTYLVVAGYGHSKEEIENHPLDNESPWDVVNWNKSIRITKKFNNLDELLEQYDEIYNRSEWDDDIPYVLPFVIGATGV